MMPSLWTTALLLLFADGSLSFECPDLMSCDCKRKNDWRNDANAYYNVVVCEQVNSEASANFTSIQNITLRKFTLKNVSYLHPDMFKDIIVTTVTLDGGTAPLDDDLFSKVKPTLRHLSLRNLTQLSLVNTSVYSYRLDILQGFDQLETLQLDWNGDFPFHFPGNVFEDLGLASLKSLTLRHCNIAKMAYSALVGLSSLEMLDLSHNQLPIIPDAILKLTNLRKIILSHNPRLSYIHKHAFHTMKKLTEIKMSYTGLHTIQSEAFYGLEQNLERLVVSHGALPNGHFESLKKLTKLTYLDISYNKIVEMHNTSFDGFHSLEELDISKQFAIRDEMAFRLNFIDAMFKGLETKLKVLRIRDLGLVSLPLASLSPLRNLQILDASKNDFTEIYESFFDGIEAKTVYLTDMLITEVDSSAFDNIEPGISFIFDRNNITNITFILDTNVCPFQKLSFLENPISCDCDVTEIMTSGRVRELIGACADEVYKGEPFSRLNELALAKGECETDRFRRNSKCSSINTASANRRVMTRVGYFICAVMLVLTWREISEYFI